MRSILRVRGEVAVSYSGLRGWVGDLRSAKRIGERTSEVSFDGNRSQVKREMRRRLIRLLVDEGKLGLVKHDDKAFLDDAATYLVANG